VAGLGGERIEAPVVKDEQLDGGEALEASGERAVTVGQGLTVEQLGRADIEHGSVVAAGRYRLGNAWCLGAHYN
jgi:hypothetical protein